MNKLNISKEDFVKSLTKIKEGLSEWNDFNDTMSKFSDGYFLVTIGNQWLQVAQELLALAVNAKDIDGYGTTISWWLYEDVDKIITVPNPEDGTHYLDVDVTTPEALYDYFVKYN